MKKKILIAVCLIVLAFTIIVPTFALANTKVDFNESDVVAFVKENKNVEKAQVVLYANKCIVAVRPKEILTKTQYLEFKADLSKQIMEKFNGIEEVIVTFSPRAFKEIEKLGKLGENDRQAKIEEILQNLSNRPRRDKRHFDKPDTMLPMA